MWGDKYSPDYISRLFGGVRRNLSRPYQTWMFSPSEEDRHLADIPGCFARLRMFDPGWQAAHGFEPGDRIVCLDLDLIITGPLDDLFDRPEPFVILQGVNTSNPCPMNGSIWMLRAGYRPDVWNDFSLEAARAIPFDSFPDDQAWFAYKLPDAGAYTDQDGVYAFHKRSWPRGETLPKNAKVVAFPGWRDPSGFTHLPWVAEHWAA